MRMILSIFIALWFGYGVLSAPASLMQDKRRSFKVESVRRGSNTIYGPAALRRAYVKYGIVPTDLGLDLDDFEPIVNVATTNSSKSVVEPDQTGAVSAASVSGDAAFVSPITVGGQKFVVTFDTGSSDLWLINTRLPETSIEGRSAFDPSKSTTFENMQGSTFNITYGDDSYAYGGVGTDTIDVGGVTVAGQAIGLPTQVSASFLEDSYTNGLVGLGFSSLNTIQPQQQSSFFETIAQVLDEPVLGASLVSDGVGEYEFGIIDRTKFKGDLVNASVDASSGFWKFESAYYKVGSGELQKNDQATATIADTGTSLMLLDQHVVDAYYAKVHGATYVASATGYIYPCSAELPNFSIAIGPQHLATVPGSLLGFSEVGTNTTTGEAVCYGGIQSNQGLSMQILGDSFLKAFYVVFDLRGPSIGIASPV
ncbi:aspartic peptidase domain-containing protein [Aspergillus cavernicola]|uniref:Aspartic peptidase domain-containing protein n=1 Tax=Aspergillus cavernicola TaxID=176166 RepID=A0ABR4INC0_9EURO